jgi:DNA-binding ferritin-like protein
MEYLITLLMQTRTLTHVLHLKAKATGSYAEHKALNELYEALPDGLDALAEQYQGRTGKLLNLNSFPAFNTSETTSLEYMIKVRSQIISIQNSYPEKNTTSDSLIDNILCDFDSCIYKLSNLQ